MTPRRTEQSKTAPSTSVRGAHIRRQRNRRYVRRRRRINWRRFLPTLILLAVFLYASINLVRYGIRSIATKQTNEELQAMYEEAMETPEAPALVAVPAPTAVPAPASTPKPELLTAYQYIGDAPMSASRELLSKNSDLVAWLRIPGVVSLPVVYRDNSYYLDHDFYGKKSESGTLFLDESHPLLADTQYMVIHGHNMYDGSMFGLLSHYRKKGYIDKHPTVRLNTLYRQEEYEVVGVMQVPGDVHSEGFVPYVGTRKFRSLDQFYGFTEILRKNALHWKDGAEIRPSDAFLSLSTCYEDDRIVVLCRRTSP